MVTNKCALSSVPYNDLSYCYGTPVLSGIRPEVYAIPSKSVVGWPTLPENKNVVSQNKSACLEGLFMPGDRNGWRKLGIVPAKSGITWETQGERPARTFVNKATFIFPGTCEEATAFARQAVHDFFIFAVQQMDGKWRILGSPEFPADVKVSGGTGEGVNGEIGTKIEIEAVCACPAPFYVGKIYHGYFDLIDNACPAGRQRFSNLLIRRDPALLPNDIWKETLTKFTAVPSSGTVSEWDNSEPGSLFFYSEGSTAQLELRVTRELHYGENLRLVIFLVSNGGVLGTDCVDENGSPLGKNLDWRKYTADGAFLYYSATDFHLRDISLAKDFRFTITAAGGAFNILLAAGLYHIQ